MFIPLDQLNIADGSATGIAGNNQAITSTGGNTTTVDLGPDVGTVIVAVFAAAGGSGTLTIVPEYSADDSSYTAIPAAQILDPTTGSTYSLTTITTAASKQVFALQKVNLERYLRIYFTGTALTQTVSTVVLALRQYSH